MKKAIRTSIAFLATSSIVVMGLSCSSDTAQKDNAANQSASNNTAATNSGSATADPSAVQFTAYDIDGASHQSSEWVTRQPVVINFWGTWCPPCRREIPDLIRFYDAYKSKGIEIVSLAVNDRAENVRAFTAKAGMKWVMLMGSDDIYQKYGGIRGVPTTIFIDRTGKEVQRFVGASNYETFARAAQMIL